MLRLFKDIELFAPGRCGRVDLLMGGGQILEIADAIRIPKAHCEVRPCHGLLAVPGFIDGHVHLLGGGGEGGYATRTPEFPILDAILGGVTTVVGCLGTDGITRSLPALLAKTRQLEAEGISAYMLTGHYGVPTRTFTGSVEEDLLLIDKVIGVGEVALADHRSSQPTFAELARLAAEARRGGMLAGKAGIVNFHLGDGPGRLELLERLVRETELPYSQFLPTHVNRSEALFEAATAYALAGGWVDLTTSTMPWLLELGEIKAARGLRRLMEAGVPARRITFTSDGQGSLPDFDSEGRLRGLAVGRVTSLFQEARSAVLEEGLELASALEVITTSPADLLGLGGKGRLQPGADADLVLLKPGTLAIDTVVARGRILMAAGRPLVQGAFPQERG